MKDKKILIVGQSGVGKSTIINTLVNYFRDGSLDNIKVAIPTEHYKDVTEKDLSHDHSEEKASKQSVSQTTECFDYKLYSSANGCNYIFIDTPGLGDTRGRDQDNKNIEKIIDRASSHDYLDTVLFIVNGVEPRFPETVASAFKRLASYLPDNIMKENVILILSKSSELSAHFPVDEFKLRVAIPKEVLYMDNTFFCKSPDDWHQNIKMERQIKNDWEDSMETIEKILKMTSEMNYKSTEDFKKIENTRDKIGSEISENMIIISTYYNLRSKLIEQKKSVNYEIEITYTETTKTPYRNIICDGCKKTCYEKTVFVFANVIPGTDCDKCGCGYSRHHKHYYTVQKCKKNVENVLKNITEKRRIDEKISDLDKIRDLTEETFNCIRKNSLDLKRICGKFDFIGELSNSIEEMKKIPSEISDSDLRKNARLKIDDLIEFFEQLSPPPENSNNSGGLREMPEKLL
ncbi:4539_t:CDS:2 [Acaulospora morrowiae]|uniref:4539_t:CDS:1 n=1 Tax=Acaulospora morrowiae TaxID=94023 RepID=A0A9N9BVS4_9GLOM|nr:4539_t:CDS:2 [Acaulospora morrowiae]